jgi:NTP pyrophosphatase (non-canonical NTP hydrolase)
VGILGYVGRIETMKIRKAQKMAFDIAEEKGFHENRRGTGRDDALVRIALIHTEVSEAAQEIKRHWPELGLQSGESLNAVGEEMADIVIRVLDFCGCAGIDLERHVVEKMEKNRARPMHYGTAKGQE